MLCRAIANNLRVLVMLKHEYGESVNSPRIGLTADDESMGRSARRPQRLSGGEVTQPQQSEGVEHADSE